MNIRIKQLLLLTFLFTLFFAGKTPESTSAKKQKQVVVQLNFGEGKELIEKTVNYRAHLSALEALLYAAKVQTYSFNEYVIVTAINDVEAEKGVTAWYYKQNGKMADKLAMNNYISPGDTIEWIFKEDICSKTVNH